MTSRGHVIAVEYTNTVFKYTADAKLAREIKLSNDILRVFHAIETSTSTSILISCKYKTATKDIHAVCEVADGGQIIRSVDIQSLQDSVIDILPSPWFPMTTDADSNVYGLGNGEPRLIIVYAQPAQRYTDEIFHDV